MIDIKGNNSDPIIARLSNFTRRRFIFNDVVCTGLESILQAFKCADPLIQAEICALSSKDANRRGREFNTWKSDQTLWWKTRPYGRATRDYMGLVTNIYDTVFAQDPTFKDDLLAIGYEEICHSIGNPNMSDTVLTEVEMLYQLNRLRLKSLANHRLVR